MKAWLNKVSGSDGLGSGVANWEIIAYLSLFVVGGALRLWDLGGQAIHHDESLHALYAWRLYSGEGYMHDPMMHGPFQFHGMALMFFLFGDSDYTARLLPAIFGIALMALPFCFRWKLGAKGAIFTSMLIMISPSLLYYSRFARNDILMAVWALALVVLIWRYIETRSDRSLWAVSAVLALSFATKETAFVNAVVLMVLLIVWQWKNIKQILQGVVAIRDAEPGVKIALMILALVLPLGSAAAGIFDPITGLTLANSNWEIAPIGMPLGSTSVVIASMIVVGLFGGSVALGLYILGKKWWLVFGVFWFLWLIFHTTVFTNADGVASGIWRSLGYWVVQQDVGRGSQPWYYYFVITPLYEFVPLVVALVGGMYYLIKGSVVGRFLTGWCVLNLVFYSIAAEKMPWLLVHITLALTVLGGYTLGQLADRLTRYYERRFDMWVWAIPVLVVGVLLFATRLLSVDIGAGSMMDRFVRPSILWIVIVGLVSCLAYIFSRTDRRVCGAIVGFSFVIIFGVVTVRSALHASFENSDIPIEMLVYTQTSPRLHKIAKAVVDVQENREQDVRVLVDSTDGYAWPWTWYFREADNVSYPCLSNDNGCSKLTGPPEADVVLLAARNEPESAPHLAGFIRAERYAHRWWFPEQYRGLTATSFLKGIVSGDSRATVAKYFLYRKLSAEIGSSDAVLYYSPSLESNFIAAGWR